MRWATVILAFVIGCAPEPGPEPAKAPEAPKEEKPSGPTRVLFIEDYPRWEYRYLRNALVRDPALVVDVFLYSADLNFPQEGSKGRKPLTELPFEPEQIEGYDVVILGDVSPTHLATASLTASGACEHLADWVKRGGGLVLVAGAKSMPAEWKDTPLRDLLPVEPTAALAGSDDAYGYGITDPGAASPILQPGDDTWTTRPGLNWLAATRAKPGSVTLVESGPKESRVPLFVTLTAGDGRVFFSATDETWRWRFRTGDAPHFYPFWQGVIRWAHTGK